MRTVLLVLALTSHAALSAEITWVLVPDVTPDGKVWVDTSSVKFDGNVATFGIKSEKQNATGFSLVTANCSDYTLRTLGGEWHAKNGKVTQEQPDKKPIPAPPGSGPGAVYRFVCDLRPAWRKWLQ